MDGAGRTQRARGAVILLSVLALAGCGLLVKPRPYPHVHDPQQPATVATLQATTIPRLFSTSTSQPSGSAPSTTVAPVLVETTRAGQDLSAYCRAAHDARLAGQEIDQLGPDPDRLKLATGLKHIADALQRFIAADPSATFLSRVVSTAREAARTLEASSSADPVATLHQIQNSFSQQAKVFVGEAISRC